jgi:hypothetical protein
MKVFISRVIRVFAIGIATTVSLQALAHDPKLHMKNAEKPKCEMMEKMKAEGKKMDPNDPVMIAMMKKCQAKHSHHDEHAKGEKHHDMGHDHAQHKMNHDEDSAGEKEHDHSH